MNSTEIVYNLKSDFPFLAEVIVYNNPRAVEQKINESYPANFENQNAMLDVIFDFASRGDEDFVNYVLSVPFLSENATPELLLAWNNIKLQAGSGARFSDWSGGMFQAIGMIGSSWVANDDTVVINEPLPNRSYDYSKFYVLGGFVVVVLIVLVLITRGKFKK